MKPVNISLVKLYRTMGLQGLSVKACGNKTALLKCAIKTVVDPPWWP